MNEEEKHGPIIPNGEPVPEGLPRWRTRHGAATVYWSSNRPMKVENVLLADGTRGDTEWSFDWGTQRRQLADGTFVHGMLQPEEDDLRFVVLPENPPPVLDPDSERLLEALRSDAGFMRDIQRKDFATALYSVIENWEVVRGEERYVIGQRSAARLIAALRNVGENYMDFAWGKRGRPREIACVEDHLRRMGFSIPGRLE